MIIMRRGCYVLAIMLALMTVIAPASTFAATGNVKISNYNAPTKIVQGNGYSLKGTIKSNKTIKRVEVGVCYYMKNQWTAQKYDNKSVYSKTFNISRADNKIRFGKIYPGTYFYRIYVHTTDGKVHTVLNRKFVVVKKQTTAKTTSTTKTVKSTTKTVAKTTTTKDARISGYNTPSNYTVGRKFNIKGTVSSNETISRIEVGIVFAPTGKWTEYKYDKRVNAKSFNLTKAASTLKFDKLPGGTYRYRIYAHTKNGVTLVLNNMFTVKPSNKPQLAVAWAKRIAADNTFSYGDKPYTCRPGCYFCGTNKQKKPKGYEKTYICMTFLGSAYAHGAKDPEILKVCKKGKLTMYQTNTNFTKFSCWHKIGLCRDLKITDLQPGDIVVRWSDDNNGHVWMYIGGNQYVDARSGSNCWGADTIAVRNGATAYLKQYSSSSKNYVMRYIH